MTVLAVVLARGGSTRLTDKNLLPLGGKPLVARAAADASLARKVDRLVVSTDDSRLADVAKIYGAEWVRRPDELCGPESKIEHAVRHALLWAEERDGRRYDYVVALQAACPVRPAGAIDRMISAVVESHSRGGVTVVPACPWHWDVSEHGVAKTWWNPAAGYPRSQDLRSCHYAEINSIQITPRAEALSFRRWGSPLSLLVLPAWAAVDIDYPSDYADAVTAWPMIEKHLRDEVRLSTHTVTVPGYESTKINLPLTDKTASGKIGIVLGNAPTIDRLPAAFWREIEKHDYISVGVNRLCCSAAAIDAGFAPDLHLIMDRYEYNKQADAWSKALMALENRTVRVVDDTAKEFPHDVKLYNQDLPLAGGAESIYMRWGSVDAAINMLYRIGCREIYIFGVEMNDAKHCAVVPPLVGSGARCAEDSWRISAGDALKDCASLPELKLFVASETSWLVANNILPFGIPAGVSALGKNA